MRRLMALFMTLVLVVSFGDGTVAHAMEPIVPISDHAAQFLGHTAGDSDEVPADADKGYPHHHAECHGHIVGVPVADAEPLPGIDLTNRISPAPARPFSTLAPEGLRRPPRA